MNLPALHVVVVGSAIGGAAAALLLARAGARVTLLEKVAQPRAVGAGIAIAENGAAVLEAIGLGATLATIGREISGVRIVNGARRTLVAAPEPATRIRMMRRSALMGMLFDAVAAQPRIEWRLGVEVTGASADGVVTTSDGELRGDLVIGADGVHSRVREAADFGARVRPPGIAYLRTLVDGELALEEEAWTPAGIFGSFAVGDGGTYVYASAGSRACRAAIEARDLPALRTAWTDAYPASAPILAAFTRFDDVLLNQVRRVDCERWSVGKLALLGDAAHAMAPNLGQGANSALVDAAVLLDELRRHDTLDAALPAYHARRAPAVRWVADTAGRLGGVAERTDRVTRWLRDRILLPIAGRNPGDLAARVLQEPAETLRAI